MHARGPETVQDGFDLIDFIRLVWGGKYLLLALIMLSAMGGAHLALTSGDRYIARMVIASLGQSGLGALSQRLSTLGLGVPELEDREFNQFRGTLRATALAQILERNYRVMPRVFAESWDSLRGEWVPPETVTARLAGVRDLLQGRPYWRPPTIDDLVEHLRDNVHIKRASYSNTIFELSYAHPNRAFAIEFLGLIHREAETLLREERKRRTLEQAQYLRSRIQATAVRDYRSSLIQLLSDQERQMMVLESDLPVATLVLDPASAPLRPKGTGLSTSVAVAMVGATALGVLLILIRRLVSDVIERYAADRFAAQR